MNMILLKQEKRSIILRGGISADQLEHILCHVGVRSLRKDSHATEQDIVNFLDICKAHPQSDAIAAFPLESILHGASQIRSVKIISALFSFSCAEKIGLRGLESASI